MLVRSSHSISRETKYLLPFRLLLYYFYLLFFQTNEVDFNIPKRRKDLVQKVVGTGIYRKIILASSLSKDIKYHPEGFPSAIPQLTLEFASLCLKNALFLLPNNNELNVPITPIAAPQTVPLSLTTGHNLGI